MGRSERNRRSTSLRQPGGTNRRRPAIAQRWWWGFAPALLLAVALVGGGFRVARPVAAQTVTVEIANSAYAPHTVTIDAGDSIAWHNGDGIPHSATADGGAFDTGTLVHGRGKA